MNLYVLPSGASKQNPSPFDAIRRRRPDGSCYWSARDMLPLMAYARWNEFKNPIERAMVSARNQGHDVDQLFRRSTEKSGGRPAEDFELSRFAAYLVAMNGDPNKAEVAAAQAYFALRTREAETGTAVPVNADALTSLTSKVRFLRDISDLLGPDSTQRYASALAASVLGAPAAAPPAASPTVSTGSARLQANALLPAFWAEFRTQLVWDLLPFTFLADLYRAWEHRHHPGSTVSAHRQFVRDLLVATADDPDWYCPGKHQQFRVSTRMADPEPLVADYDLMTWQRASHKAVYRGVLRQP